MTRTPNIEHRTPTIALIVAASTNNVIGVDGALPWRLPDDLQHFKRLTSGNTIIMGRKTFDSIGRSLPNRQNIVITRQADWQADGVSVAHDLDEAIRAAEHEDIFIAGGQQIYTLALPRADRLYLTRVYVKIEGEAKFEGFDPAQWNRVESIEHPSDERHPHAFSFEMYERRTTP